MAGNVAVSSGASLVVPHVGRGVVSPPASSPVSSSGDWASTLAELEVKSRAVEEYSRLKTKKGIEKDSYAPLVVERLPGGGAVVREYRVYEKSFSDSRAVKEPYVSRETTYDAQGRVVSENTFVTIDKNPKNYNGERVIPDTRAKNVYDDASNTYQRVYDRGEAGRIESAPLREAADNLLLESAGLNPASPLRGQWLASLKGEAYGGAGYAVSSPHKASEFVSVETYAIPVPSQGLMGVGVKTLYTQDKALAEKAGGMPYYIEKGATGVPTLRFGEAPKAEVKTISYTTLAGATAENVATNPKFNFTATEGVDFLKGVHAGSRTEPHTEFDFFPEKKNFSEKGVLSEAKIDTRSGVYLSQRALTAGQRGRGEEEFLMFAAAGFKGGLDLVGSTLRHPIQTLIGGPVEMAQHPGEAIAAAREAPAYTFGQLATGTLVGTGLKLGGAKYAELKGLAAEKEAGRLLGVAGTEFDGVRVVGRGEYLTKRTGLVSDIGGKQTRINILSNVAASPLGEGLIDLPTAKVLKNVEKLAEPGAAGGVGRESFRFEVERGGKVRQGVGVSRSVWLEAGDVSFFSKETEGVLQTKKGTVRLPSVTEVGAIQEQVTAGGTTVSTGTSDIIIGYKQGTPGKPSSAEQVFSKDFGILNVELAEAERPGTIQVDRISSGTKPINVYQDMVTGKRQWVAPVEEAGAPKVFDVRVAESENVVSVTGRSAELTKGARASGGLSRAKAFFSTQWEAVKTIGKKREPVKAALPGREPLLERLLRVNKGAKASMAVMGGEGEALRVIELPETKSASLAGLKTSEAQNFYVAKEVGKLVEEQTFKPRGATVGVLSRERVAAGERFSYAGKTGVSGGLSVETVTRLSPQERVASNMSYRMLSEVVPKSASRLSSESLSVTRSGLAEESKLSTESRLSQETKLSQSQKLGQEQLLSQEMKLTSRSTGTVGVTTLAPPMSTPLMFSTRDDRRKKRSALFGVFVKKRGKFVKTGSGLELGEAVTAGRRRVEGSAAASFKIVPEGGSEKVDVAALLPSSVYTRSKKEANVFVQRRGKRISSAGEKREIRPRRRFV